MSSKCPPRLISFFTHSSCSYAVLVTVRLPLVYDVAYPYLLTTLTAMATTTTLSAAVSPSCLPSKSLNPLHFTNPKTTIPVSKSNFVPFPSQSLPVRPSVSLNLDLSRRLNTFVCSSSSTVSTSTTNYEFSDGSDEVELRLLVGNESIQSSKDVFVDANENLLTIKTKRDGLFITVMEISLYEKIKPAETIWLLDDDQLIVNLKKQDPDVKWPDITETWESLTVGVMQLLKGTSVYLVGESSEINYKVSRVLAVGLGYTPLNTTELLETFTKQTVDSLVITEGSNAVADTESAILESLSSHIRSVVATIGGKRGAAASGDRWRHLYAGFTVWLSQSEAKDEESAKEEARMNIKSGSQGYSKADLVVKLSGWDNDCSKAVAQVSLSALKRLILSDKKLPGKKGLYIRLGCRGDWPNIKPPGWDPSTGMGSV